MRQWQGKTYWIVGASEGLGRALAERLSTAGATLILSARSADKLEALAQSLPGKARAVAMDVRDEDNIARAAGEVGEIDGLIYLAGVYWPQPATEWNADQVTAMFDVNTSRATASRGTSRRVSAG